MSTPKKPSKEDQRGEEVLADEGHVVVLDLESLVPSDEVLGRQTNPHSQAWKNVPTSEVDVGLLEASGKAPGSLWEAPGVREASRRLREASGRLRGSGRLPGGSPGGLGEAPGRPRPEMAAPTCK